MTTDETMALRLNVETLIANNRALFTILGALVSVTLDSDQKHGFAALLEEHVKTLDSQIPDEDAHGPGVVEEAVRLQQEQAAYICLIDVARQSSGN